MAMESECDFVIRKEIIIVEIANYIIKNKSSVRHTSEYFGIPNTTLRRKVQTLSLSNPELYEKVRKLWSDKATTIPRIYSETSILELADLIIETGLSLSMISKITNVPRKSIEDSLNRYLRDVDMERYLKYKEVVELNTYLHDEIDNVFLKELSTRLAKLIIINNFSMKELCDYIASQKELTTKREIYNAINNHLGNQKKIINYEVVNLHDKVLEVFKNKAFEIIDKYKDDVKITK